MLIKYNKKLKLKSFLWFFLKIFFGFFFILLLILFIKLRDFESKQPLRLTQINYYLRDFLTIDNGAPFQVKVEPGKGKTLKINDKQNIPQNKK